MSMGLLVLAIILIVVFVNLRNKNNELKKEVASTQAALTEATKNYNKAKSELAATTTERDSLIKKYASVIDAEAEAKTSYQRPEITQKQRQKESLMQLKRTQTR